MNKHLILFGIKKSYCNKAKNNNNEEPDKKSTDAHKKNIGIKKINESRTIFALLFVLIFKEIILFYQKQSSSERKMVTILNNNKIFAPKGGPWVLSQLQKVILRLKAVLQILHNEKLTTKIPAHLNLNEYQQFILATQEFLTKNYAFYHQILIHASEQDLRKLVDIFNNQHRSIPKIIALTQKAQQQNHWNIQHLILLKNICEQTNIWKNKAKIWQDNQIQQKTSTTKTLLMFNNKTAHNHNQNKSNYPSHKKHSKHR